MSSLKPTTSVTSSIASSTSTSTSSTKSTAHNLRVFLRVRPPLPKEPADEGTLVISAPSETAGTQSVSVVQPDANRGGRHGQTAFTFDGVFGPRSTQLEVCAKAVDPQVAACLQGFNSTVFCYGPSGTGKSFTCYGPAGGAISGGGSAAAARWAASPEAGMIPRAAEQLFATIERGGSLQHGRFLLRVSFLQLYREGLSDLLAPNGGAGQSLALREDPHRGVYVEGLTEVAVRSPQEMWALAAKGQKNRQTAATRLNDVSSRSHAVFTVVVEQRIVDKKGGHAAGGDATGAPAAAEAASTSGGGASAAPAALKLSRLNLVDLAGSERAALMGETGERLEESKKINLSLSALAKVRLLNHGSHPQPNPQLPQAMDPALCSAPPSLCPSAPPPTPSPHPSARSSRRSSTRAVGRCTCPIATQNSRASFKTPLVATAAQR